MADNLVRALNKLGYQPVFLPRTGVTPPELYSYTRETQRLVRFGALTEYIPAVAALEPTSGRLADIDYEHTSSKKLDAAVSFLETALKCIGISAVPKIDLKFAGSNSFKFAFTGVTYKSVDPARLGRLLASMTTDGIPQEYVREGQLHIAYEYAYTQELLLKRSDQQSFSAGVSGDIGSYLDLGAEGSVSVSNDSTISFKSNAGAPAAFAYKAGRFERNNGRWELFPEVVTQTGLVEEREAFVPQRATVLTAITS